MGSRCDMKRMNVEGDRLSNLPDDLIHKILSLVSIKHAVGTSVLSSRWRYIWTSMPCLNFSSKDFDKLPTFSKFVTHVLSRRDNEIEVSSVELTFRGKVSQAFVKRILNYACSHNAQQLKVACLPRKKIKSPLPAFSFRSLKYLTLIGWTDCHLITTPSTWELPDLITLNLDHVALRDENTTDNSLGLFYNCANLKNLTLRGCVMIGGLNNFNICHPGLSNLTLEGNYTNGTSNVVTPQLKKLTVIKWTKMDQIVAPDLVFLQYEDYYNPLQLSTDHLHLEKVDICIRWPSGSAVKAIPFKVKANCHKILCMLQLLHSVKFLTLNLEIVKLISSSVELISHQPSPFVNLKSLKVYPVDVRPEEQTQPKVTMSTEVKNYFLDGSPGATLTMVSHEEIRTAMNVASALKLMRDLQAQLDWWKENSETNTAHKKPDKASKESHMETVHAQGEVENLRAQPDTKMKCHFGERMSHIKSYWKDLNEQLEKRYKNSSDIFSMLKRIEEVLTKLPTSDKDKLKARFSGLCEEVETIMDNKLDV